MFATSRVRAIARTAVAVLFGLLAPLAALAQTAVYEQAPNGIGFEKSAWFPPDGLDGDEYVWDDFVIPAGAAITEVRWRGCSLYGNLGWVPSVGTFTIGIYASITGGSQPDVVAAPLKRWTTSGNAEMTPAGTVNGYPMYDFHSVLPSAFQAQPGVKYWIRVVANSTGYPDWSWATAGGGNNRCFRFITGGMYQSLSKDMSFTLFASAAPSFTVSTVAAPAGAGSVLGGGAYPAGSTASLTATPAAGWGLVDWTVNGAHVSGNNPYAFTVTANRTVTANFAPTHTVTTVAQPSFGGSVTAGGTYLEGTALTYAATPAAGFHFAGWTDWGNPVSSSLLYELALAADASLAAHFEPDANTVLFDFDSGAPAVVPGNSLPPLQTWGGVSVQLEGNFSIQTDGSWAIGFPDFVGNYLFPGNGGYADLTMRFSEPLTLLACDFANPVYQWQDIGATWVRMDAYRDSLRAPLVATTQSLGTWTRSAFATGHLLLDSGGEPFDVVRIHVPPQVNMIPESFLDSFVGVRFADLTPPTATLLSANGGESWPAGSTQEVRWEASDNVGVTGVSLALSTDGGATFDPPFANALSNSGTYAWVLPAVNTTTARLRLVVADAAGHLTVVESAADFSILATTGVGAHARAALSLSPPTPNPGAGPATIRFALPAAVTARLEVLDLAGRRVAGLTQSWSAGAHEWSWDGRADGGSPLRAGMYFVRLVTPFGSRVARAARLD